MIGLSNKGMENHGVDDKFSDENKSPPSINKNESRDQILVLCKNEGHHCMLKENGHDSQSVGKYS